MPIATVIGGGLTADRIPRRPNRWRTTSCRWKSFWNATRRWRRSAARTRFAPAGTPRIAEAAGEFGTTPEPFARSAPRRPSMAANPKLIGLMNSWGGVTLAYRRRLIDAPSYTLNHEEVGEGAGGRRALRRGGLRRGGRRSGRQYGHAAALHLTKHTFDPETKKMSAAGEPVLRLPARSILVAAGTQPEYRAGPRRSGQRVSSMAAGSRRWTRTDTRPSRQARLETQTGVGAYVARTRGRPAPSASSAICRSPPSRGTNGGQGHGQREAGASGGDADAFTPPSGGAALAEGTIGKR